jgi:hypothetical protein
VALRKIGAPAFLSISLQTDVLSDATRRDVPIIKSTAMTKRHGQLRRGARCPKRTRREMDCPLMPQFFVFAEKEKIKALCSLHVRNCLIAKPSGSLKTEKFEAAQRGEL